MGAAHFPGHFSKMTFSRVVIMICATALLPSGRATAKDIQEITASVGQNVLLPCPCPDTTCQVVWQINDIVVNQHGAMEKSNTPSKYSQRSHLFLPVEKGNCSLLLLNVSLFDQKIFTCYSFRDDDFTTKHINLTVIDSPRYEGNTMTIPAPTVDGPGKREGKHTAGVTAAVIAVMILTGGIFGVLLIRKRHQRTQRMDASTVQYQQSKQPMLV